jgi:hypothetical protein
MDELIPIDAAGDDTDDGEWVHADTDKAARALA